MNKFHVTHYEYNPETNYFQKSIHQTDISPVKRMPFELHFEPTQLQHIKCNASTLLTSKKVKERYLFYTGVQRIATSQNWYVGNLLEKSNPEKITSCVIVYHSKEQGKLSVYYFRYFDKLTTAMRHEFAKEFISNENKNGSHQYW